MRALARFLLFLLLPVLALVSCTPDPGPVPEPPQTGTAEPPSSPSDGAVRITEDTEGDFVFTGSTAEHPVKVWYSAPPDLAAADILVVMPGTNRNAEDYRTDWVPLTEDRNTLVLVPEFAEDDFPGTSYNLGNMTDEDDDLRPREQWAFTIIEELFDAAVEATGSSAGDYALFGHSAGAQFVHRFVEFMPQARIRTAVAANAGWYTTLNEDEDFPYGLDGAPAQLDDMDEAFSRDLVILVGADDIDPRDDSLQRDDRTDEQGTNRLERGLNFYLTAREAADDVSAKFGWRLMVLPGIAHDHARMAQAAAPLLLR